MAFATYDDYKTTLNLRSSADFIITTLGGTPSTRLFLASTGFAVAPSTPTSSVALDKTNARAINNLVPNGGAGRLSILGGNVSSINGGNCSIILADLLNISGGLDATLTTAQTTNLPTAALTRYTSGEGVCAGIVIHSPIGSTATTVTCSYTNQSGTSGRVSPAITIGSFGFAASPQILRLSMQDGDTGVRSVESVTLAGTTGFAGNFGVILYKPLAMMFPNEMEHINHVDCVSTGKMVGQLNEVLDDACLSIIGSFNTGGAFSGSIFLGEA